uniref:Uncharacterized protein n=1 Tax=Pyxicephalus adspersus TaxID=30357 RepID=A0AAV3AP57_PYXAD|nr:TPA: hypothetical protein GDO54_008699 [Pyxicephalus adspersus]
MPYAQGMLENDRDIIKSHVPFSAYVLQNGTLSSLLYPTVPTYYRNKNHYFHILSSGFSLQSLIGFWDWSFRVWKHMINKAV